MKAYLELIEYKDEIIKFVDKKMNFLSHKFKKEDIISECIRNFIHDRIYDFVEFEEYFVGGVYFIEDFYIGRSGNIHNRMASHITDIFITYRGHNYDKSKLIEKILSSGRKIKVKQISKNQNDESSLIKEYSKVFNLTNIEFNDNYKSVFNYNKLKYIEEKKDYNITNDLINESSLTKVINIVKNIDRMEYNILFDINNPCIVIVNNLNKNTFVYKRKSIVDLFNEIIKNYKSKMTNEINNYGIDNFSVTIIDRDDKDELSNEYISKGYNVITRIIKKK